MGSDWSVLWAACGAAGLTGRRDGPPLDVPVGVVRLATELAVSIGEVSGRLGRAIDLDGPELLGERAAMTGLARTGDVSCGGATRLLHAADGWLAVSLARDEDIAAVPAWLEVSMPDDGHERWAAIADVVARRPSNEIVERGVLLGLPIARRAEVRMSADAAPATWRQVSGASARRRPLDDAVVIDLSSLWAGPLAASILGLAGARVITVESVHRPDGARSGSAAFFDLLHVGSESVCLDFRNSADVAALRRLLEKSDVVIEASRPRALAHLGLDRDTVLGPRVWASITGHGRVGPAADRIGFGDDAAVAGGLVAVDATGPCFVVDAVADPLTGLAAADAVLGRFEAGGSWHLDLSLARTAAIAATPAITDIGSHTLAPPRGRAAVGRAPTLGAHTDAVLDEFARR